MQVAYHLAGEPLVELLVRVQHQAFLLGPLFALSHQCGIFIPFKEPRNLGDRTASLWSNYLVRRYYETHYNTWLPTSPLARRVFIRSRNPESKTLDSSIMNAIFSFLQPERLRTVLRSSSKSSPVYFLWTCRSSHSQGFSHTTATCRIKTLELRG